MPYITDNINNYLYSLITDRFDALVWESAGEHSTDRILDIINQDQLGSLIDYCEELIDEDGVGSGIATPFKVAILNTINKKALMMDLQDWLKTEYSSLYRTTKYERKKAEVKARVEEKEYYYATTIVKGIICTRCCNELPPMTMKDHLESNFNEECPHTPTVAMKECDWCVLPSKVPMSQLTYIIDKASPDRDEGLACKTCTEKIEIRNMKKEVCIKVESTPMSKEHLNEWMTGLGVSHQSPSVNSSSCSGHSHQQDTGVATSVTSPS